MLKGLFLGMLVATLLELFGIKEFTFKWWMFIFTIAIALIIIT